MALYQVYIYKVENCFQMPENVLGNFQDPRKSPLEWKSLVYISFENVIGFVQFFLLLRRQVNKEDKHIPVIYSATTPTKATRQNCPQI